MSDVPTKWFSYEYYDTPQGKDIARKMFWTMRYCVPACVLISVYDIILYKDIKTFGSGLARFFYLSIPFVVVPLTAVSISNISASIRDKDDKLNYALGGFTAGKLLGRWLNSPGHGTFFGVVFALLGVIRKDLLDIGYNLDEPDQLPVSMRSSYSKYLDFTIRADRPGNWTRE